MNKKSKIFKIVVSFSLILVFLSSFVVVNAQNITSGDTTLNCYDSNLSFEITDVSFVVTRYNNSSGTKQSYDGGSLTITSQDNGIQLRLNLNSDIGTLKNGDIVDVAVSLRPVGNALTDSTLNVNGNLRMGIKSDSGVVQPAEMVGYREELSSGFYQSANCQMTSSDWGNYCVYYFNETSFGYTFDDYFLGFNYVVSNASSYASNYCRYVYLAGATFKTYTKEEMAAEQIIDNQNENTDKIIDNENQNHDELINGRDYADVDGTTVNDYGAAESQLNSATSSAQSDSISFINNFGNLFGSSHVHNGLLAVSAITKELFAINWVSDILTFALGLGCFAFILGTSYLIISRASSNERYKQSRESRRYTKKGGGG